MTGAELEDVATDLLSAFLAGRRDRAIDLLAGILAGPRGDSRAVAIIYASIVADGMPPLLPGQEFHSLQVEVLDQGIPRPGSADDLPGHSRTFMQMVIAEANGERETAMALFRGYVDDDASRAALIIGLGLGLAARQTTGARCNCPPGTHP